MFHYSQLEDLLDEIGELMDKLSQLDKATDNVRNITESIAQSCTDLKPKHNSMSEELERLSRLQEVLRAYVLPRSESEPVCEASPSPSGVGTLP